MLACCLPGGECQYVWEQEECEAAGGHLFPEGFLCEWYHCPTSCSCCFEDGSCLVLLPDECEALGGVSNSESEACEPNPCLVSGAPDEGRVGATWGRLRTIYR